MIVNRLRRLVRATRRRTLVDTLQRDISRADGAGPDWLVEVEVACARQDLDWAPTAVEPARVSPVDGDLRPAC
jgi:hypothetical protein